MENSRKEVILIAAMEVNRAIGKDNKLLHNIKEDLARFKEITTGKPIVMGRKTFESLPNGALPDRVNYVLTSDENYKADGCVVVNSIDNIIQLTEGNEEVFVIGGESIYKQFMPIATKIYLTIINHETKDADTYFPEIDKKDWQMISQSEPKKVSKKGVSYKFVEFVTNRYK